MMNMQPSEAKALSLYEYEMMLHNWAKAHDPDHVDIVAPDVTQDLITKLKAKPELLQRANP